MDIGMLKALVTDSGWLVFSAVSKPTFKKSKWYYSFEFAAVFEIYNIYALLPTPNSKFRKIMTSFSNVKHC